VAALIGAALAAILIVVVTKFTPHQRMMAAEAPRETDSRKEILDRIVTLVGGIFAFILGLVIVTNWQVMTASRQTTIDEVNGLSQIYSAAHALPQPQHAFIRSNVRMYVTTVIGTEWPLMSSHQMSHLAQQQIDDLRNSVQNWDTSTPRLATMQGQALSGITAAYSARRTRAMEAEEGLPTFMWGLLIGDGFIMLSVPLLKGIHFTRTNVVLYMLFGVMIALSLWFVYELNYPFSGGLTVKPDAYLIFLQQASPPGQ
jgi:uncharacterized membrane protein HdeD (DUF308 family)